MLLNVIPRQDYTFHLSLTMREYIIRSIDILYIIVLRVRLVSVFMIVTVKYWNRKDRRAQLSHC